VALPADTTVLQAPNIYQEATMAKKRAAKKAKKKATRKKGARKAKKKAKKAR